MLGAAGHGGEVLAGRQYELRWLPDDECVRVKPSDLACIRNLVCCSKGSRLVDGTVPVDLVLGLYLFPGDTVLLEEAQCLEAEAWSAAGCDGEDRAVGEAPAPASQTLDEPDCLGFQRAGFDADDEGCGRIGVRDPLGGGGMASLRLDSQAKTYAQMLLSLEINIPKVLL